ncbi:hypothetical protein [Aeromicrobium sp. 50.2.37]|uniref:hypothetical protein n=1 Tax=Aeromicrobium sp. 50.2.37 TaxID=2969305 RepID=UPI00214FB43E|nr:hypothetical protein [Aeromicrobium sp. 50.2.37]MCR4512146.1 hypothetical protein [Aeromicrobium sp. 50.2.37]
MTTIRTVLAATAAVGLTLALGAAPAQADNPVITGTFSAAKYVDVTDQLCVRVEGTLGSTFYAEALIRKDGTTVASRFKVGNNDGSWSCTRNLSIPEDRAYTLVLRDCTTNANPSCTTKRKSFYS